ncbi:hypothetical protein ACQPZX_38160 [Actinoplanes sp. CA-142083]|uniref:hypothetical protein n=1 Tax=Actinoplanes sp. CA-142083 TaxID=3239903 RepID=UPI003D8C54A9
MDEHGRLGETQRQDLRDRVRRYLGYLATEGRINPRDVKRYLNAYTLHRMVRPDLDAATVLALQTIDFRSDWDKIYEDVALAEPDVFVAALNSFRDGDSHAFEDLWPEIGVLPLELSGFLRSAEAAPLAAAQDLERYVSFLETTRTTQSWVKDAMRDVGTLRQYVRRARPPLRFASPEARTIAVQVKDVLGRLSSYQQANGAFGKTLERPLSKLQSLISVLAPSSTDEPEETSPAQLESWRQDVRGEIDVLQQELRLIRRASETSPG